MEEKREGLFEKEPPRITDVVNGTEKIPIKNSLHGVPNVAQLPSELLTEPSQRFPEIRRGTDRAFGYLFALVFGVGLALFVAQIFRYCYQPQDLADAAVISQSILNVAALFMFFAFLSVIFSVLWLGFMANSPKFIVHASISGGVSILLVLILISFGTHNVFAYFLMILLGWNLLLLAVFRGRIAFARHVLQAAATIISETRPLYRLSLVILIIQVALGAIFLVGLQALFYGSHYLRSGSSVALFVFLLFWYYWTTQVLKYILHTTSAGVIASWYFVAPQPHDGVMGSLKRAVTTSFGSVCLGALTTTIMKFLSTVLPCFCCQMLVNYFNRYAFVQVATYGKSFCSSAKSTVQLFKLHGCDAIVNDDITTFIMVMGCIFVGGLATICLSFFASFWAFSSDEMVVILIFSFFIAVAHASTAVEIMDSAVATLFVCFVENPQRLKETKPETYEAFKESYRHQCIGLFPIEEETV